jgi:hypothetical protein
MGIDLEVLIHRRTGVELLAKGRGQPQGWESKEAGGKTLARANRNHI